MDKLRKCPICNAQHTYDTIEMVGHKYNGKVVSELSCGICGFAIMVPNCDFDRAIECWNNIRRPRDAVHSN